MFAASYERRFYEQWFSPTPYELVSLQRSINWTKVKWARNFQIMEADLDVHIYIRETIQTFCLRYLLFCYCGFKRRNEGGKFQTNHLKQNFINCWILQQENICYYLHQFSDYSQHKHNIAKITNNYVPILFAELNDVSRPVETRFLPRTNTGWIGTLA